MSNSQLTQNRIKSVRLPANWTYDYLTIGKPPFRKIIRVGMKKNQSSIQAAHVSYSSLGLALRKTVIYLETNLGAGSEPNASPWPENDDAIIF